MEAFNSNTGKRSLAAEESTYF